MIGAPRRILRCVDDPPYAAGYTRLRSSAFVLSLSKDERLSDERIVARVHRADDRQRFHRCTTVIGNPPAVAAGVYECRAGSATRILPSTGQINYTGGSEVITFTNAASLHWT